MYLTQKDIYETYKISRSTLLTWEDKGILKQIVKLPLSSHRRYLKSEIEEILRINVGGV